MDVAYKLAKGEPPGRNCGWWPSTTFFVEAPEGDRPVY
jgi:hypothetical protein